MSEAIDYSAINWVRQELGETLKQARCALEGYARQPDDPQALRACREGLHQAGGSLRMVEVQDTALLVSEMEALVEALEAGRIHQPDVALERLLQAFHRLPVQLERLSVGQPDTGAGLLALINGLRDLRGAGPLPAATEFDPDLTRPLPACVFDPHSVPPVPDVRELARTSRQRFQVGLLDWYRSADATGLQHMHAILVELLQASGQEAAARLWWLGAGLAEALLQHGLPVSAEAKRLFGQFDQQLKQLIDADEAVFAAAIPQALLRELLLQISGATGAATGHVREISDTYGLRNAAPPEDANLSGRSAELLGGVAAVALEVLARLREQLEALCADSASGPAGLDAVVDELHELVNSLDVAGLESASQALSDCEQHLRDMGSGKREMTEAGMQEIASAVIGVEDMLEAARAGDAGPSPGAHEAGSACREGLETAIREVVADMVQCRNAIDDYLNKPQVPGQLEGVPALLGRVRGGLQLIGQERAALIVAQITEYIEHALVGGDGLPVEWQLDTLADAFCAVEYHIAELGEKRDHGETVLDMAEQSLLRLGRRDREPLDDGEGNAQLLQGGLHGTDIPVISTLPVLAGDTDSEILDIFIEEAGGELQRLAEQVPHWVAQPDDTETLETIRRSFHTLKGGGRVAGALALGEFSAVLEQLLNQVATEVIVPEETLREFVAQALHPLAQLYDQLRGGPAPQVDVDAIVAQAVRFADPGAPAAVASSATVTEHVTPPAAVVDDGADGTAARATGTPAPEQTPAGESTCGLVVLNTDADPEIVEVFREEAAEVMAEIVQQLPVWARDQGNDAALATIRRCFHTLKGSGRIAGAMRVGEFSWAIENLLNRVIDASVPVSEELITLLLRVPDALAELVNQVSGGPPPEADYQEMMTAADNLARGESSGFVGEGGHAGASPDTAHTETAAGEEAHPGGEPALQEIFAREARDHLELIREFIAGCERADGACVVSEDLYRALHTLSGISEAAQATPVQALAGGLYSHVAQLKEMQQPVDSILLAVLRDCTQALGEIIARLPDMSFDANRQQQLLDRIAGLPPVPVGDETSRRTAVVDEAPVTAHTETDAASGQAAAVEQPASGTETGTQPVPDPYAGLDPDLLEVFLEEAGEIIERSEITLYAWAKEPGRDELLKEFQRQLHTLKGGARMADIRAIGNLSHGLETLVTRVADGHATMSTAMFELLHVAHDRLADMLEQVRARRLPATAAELEQELDRYGAEPGIEAAEPVVTVDETTPAPQADSAGAASAILAPEPGLQPEPPADAGAEDDTPLAQHGPQFGGQPAELVVARVPAAGAGPAAAPADALEQVVAQSSHPDEMQQGEVIPARAERRRTPRLRGEQVRVQADLLDNLVNYAGEINIYRSRLEQQAGAYRFNLAEFDQTINRLREQLRKFEILTESRILYRHGQENEDRNPEFDPLEMDRYSTLQQQSRLLLESINDLNSIQQMLVATTREFETLLLQQSRVSTDLQEGLMHTRMIPFAGLAPRLRRIVRQAAQELDKQVELGIEGADGEMDRTVIERIVAPLEHMLRNAVDHGIETTGQRRAAGKPETGAINISFHREGPEIVLRIADDGRGVDVAAIRERARERGLIAAGDRLPDSEVMQLILQAGFTTASKVTQISGRGVGMDVVVSEVKQLGGSLHIDSTPGRGSVFTIRLPYTLAINQALLVRACDDTFCIPLGNIEGVIRVAAEELSECLHSPEARYEYAGNEYRLQHLGTLLNRGALNPEGLAGRVPVLLVRVGEQRVAIIVEALLGHREIVVKPLGAQLSHVDGVSGATILGDGRVVLILDLAGVVRMGNRSRHPAGETRREAGARLEVMVVDDSITVRKVTARLLQKYGFDVVTAKDGVDAMGMLQETVPDAMLLDVEMPRMDGFELATLMRNDERTRHVPIIMITSRTGDKHRERAGQIGVDQYLGKPYQEHELLATIHRLIGLPDSNPRVAES